MNSSFSASAQNELKIEARTVETISEQMQKTHFFTVLAALNIKNMTKKNQDCSRRSSVAPKYCVCVVKFIAVTIVKVKNIGLEVNG